MKILYLSVHSVLEYDELRILTELDEATQSHLNIEVYSMGAYSNPTQSGDYKRSVIPKGRFYSHLYDLEMQCSKEHIHPELVEWADVIISMHNSRLPGQIVEQPWIVNNWELFRKLGKKVVWRSIGQSTPEIEKELVKYRGEGLKLLRYSPLEEKLPNFAGVDALIRFAKDEDEFSRWSGHRKQVITVAQSMKQRASHLGYPIFEKVTEGLQRRVFGNGNEDLGEVWGGAPSYEELKRVLQESRVFFYFGTVPAPYTLSLIEAMMTGIPVVAVGKTLRELHPYNWPNYEVPDIIVNGVNGFISDTPGELRGYIQQLLDNDELAQRIGLAGRKTAIELWGRKQRMNEWGDFMRRL